MTVLLSALFLLGVDFDLPILDGLCGQSIAGDHLLDHGLTLAARNRHPSPFVWTATVRQILTKVNKAKETLATLHE